MNVVSTFSLIESRNSILPIYNRETCEGQHISRIMSMKYYTEWFHKRKQKYREANVYFIRAFNPP